MKQYYRQIGIAISVAMVLTSGVTGCAQLDPHKTIWEVTKESTGIGSREREYQQSGDEHDLVMPAGMTLANSKASHPIPTVSSQETSLSDSNLPPESLAARIYLTKQDPNALQNVSLKHIKATRQTSNGDSLVLNSQFQSAWDVTGLAIMASHYQLVKTNYELGAYFIKDAQQVDNVYQVIVQGATGESHITVFDEKGHTLSTNQTEQMLQTLRKQLLALNSINQPAAHLASLVTSDVYGNSTLLLNRAAKRGASVMTENLKKAKFTLVKSDPKHNAYYFVNTRKTNGKINKNMPVYLLYGEDSGVYSRYYVLVGSDVKLLPAKQANVFLTAISQAINQD